MGVYTLTNYHLFIQESVTEKLVASSYCLDYKKNSSEWGSNGCLGHPALTLLLSIIDSIGSYVIGGDTRKHFDILKDENYYPEVLTDIEIERLYTCYRNPQTHNSTLPPDTTMNIGIKFGKFISIEGRKTSIFLEPLYYETELAVKEFLKDIKNKVFTSDQIKNILKLPHK